jgi:hypothetical protein
MRPPASSAAVAGQPWRTAHPTIFADGLDNRGRDGERDGGLDRIAPRQPRGPRERRAVHPALAAFSLVVVLLVPASAAAAASGNHFDAGYCTWQAAELAYEAWGTWLPWFGDAGDWAPAAQASGWTVSTTPTVSSIAAMPRGVQGSGGYGHVGWVIDVDPDDAGVTLVSMNWRGRGIVSEHHIQVDGLVAFITPPATR